MNSAQIENNKIYIENSKKNIDSYIANYKYKEAFYLFIMVLERLDSEDKIWIIDNYSKSFDKLIKEIGICSLNPYNMWVQR